MQVFSFRLAVAVVKKHGCSATKRLDGLIKSWPRSDLLIHCLLRNGPKCDTADSAAWGRTGLLVNDMRIDSPGAGFVGDTVGSSFNRWLGLLPLHH